MSDTILIFGSSRDSGLHHRVVDAVLDGARPEIIDLHHQNIAYYDYTNNYAEGDDFLKIAGKMAAAQTIIFATPVYWYAMSAQLKTFFDRFTDLVTVHKTEGRKLAGRKMHLLAWGHEVALPQGFEVPFASTAQYLDMVYQGCFYYCTGPDADVEQRREAELFRHSIFG